MGGLLNVLDVLTSRILLWLGHVLDLGGRGVGYVWGRGVLKLLSTGRYIVTLAVGWSGRVSYLLSLRLGAVGFRGDDLRKKAKVRVGDVRVTEMEGGDTSGWGVVGLDWS